MKSLFVFLFRFNALLAMRFVLIILFCTVLNTHLSAQSENDIYCYIKQIGIKFPEVVLRQAIYETGHFRSNIYQKKNNLFGFRKKRYMAFDDWKACVDYYKVWQDKHYTNNETDYYVFLQKKNFSGRKKFRYDIQLQRTHIKATLNCIVDGKKE